MLFVFFYCSCLFAPEIRWTFIVWALLWGKSASYKTCRFPVRNFHKSDSCVSRMKFPFLVSVFDKSYFCEHYRKYWGSVEKSFVFCDFIQELLVGCHCTVLRTCDLSVVFVSRSTAVSQFVLIGIKMVSFFDTTVPVIISCSHNTLFAKQTDENLLCNWLMRHTGLVIPLTEWLKFARITELTADSFTHGTRYLPVYDLARIRCSLVQHS